MYVVYYMHKSAERCMLSSVCIIVMTDLHVSESEKEMPGYINRCSGFHVSMA